MVEQHFVESGHGQQLPGVSLRHSSRLARDNPDDQETQACANDASDEKALKKRFALEDQQNEVGCAA